MCRPDPGTILLLMMSLFLFTGCANMFIQQYGYVSSDAESIRADGKAVSIPASAPSISQGYKPGTFGKTALDTSRNHEGIDIISKKGTPVIAAAPGVVISSFYRPLFGNRILINHGKDVNGLFVFSRYVHLDKRLVEKGDSVSRGQQIGTLGSTGLLAGGFPHLHFEIRTGLNPNLSKSKPLNPHGFWMDGVGTVTCFDVDKLWPDNPFGMTYPVPCR
ncbi:MAG: M23 family metallopeptidase [Nitrospiraceae bacterium]|nr:MAG: M23 family metallopeptidase [Nitrospiraceae bacterium]